MTLSQNEGGLLNLHLDLSTGGGLLEQVMGL